MRTKPGILRRSLKPGFLGPGLLLSSTNNDLSDVIPNSPMVANVQDTGPAMFVGYSPILSDQMSGLPLKMIDKAGEYILRRSDVMLGVSGSKKSVFLEISGLFSQRIIEMDDVYSADRIIAKGPMMFGENFASIRMFTRNRIIHRAFPFLSPFLGQRKYNILSLRRQGNRKEFFAPIPFP